MSTVENMIEKVTAEQFTQLIQNSDVPVLVDFYADWCRPCQAQTPVLESVAQHQGDKLRVVKVDVDSEQALAGEFGVRSIPTLVLLKSGEPVETSVGLHTETQLNAMLQTHAGTGSDRS